MPTDLSRNDLDLCKLTSDPSQPSPTFSPPLCWESPFVTARRFHSTFLPNDWVPDILEDTPDLVGMPARIPDATEFAVLHDYRLRFRSSAEHDIDVQNGSGYRIDVDVARPLWGILGSPGTTPTTTAFASQLKTLLSWADLDAKAAVTQQKLLFNRARPYQLDAMIQPLFMPPHPSYPSGHATESHAVAFMIVAVVDATSDPRGKLTSARAAILTKAREISVDREVAGVHFPSDTQAGIRLARKIIDSYLADQSFRRDYFNPTVDELSHVLA